MLLSASESSPSWVLAQSKYPRRATDSASSAEFAGLLESFIQRTLLEASPASPGAVTVMNMSPLATALLAPSSLLIPGIQVTKSGMNAAINANTDAKISAADRRSLGFGAYYQCTINQRIAKQINIVIFAIF